ncbi:MAG TPA: hypothetical protein PKM48_01560 [Parvularculaceae bacterium]|nr:hypothetical protein [Parvularculaceae bacterium]
MEGLAPAMTRRIAPDLLGHIAMARVNVGELLDGRTLFDAIAPDC